MQPVSHSSYQPFLIGQGNSKTGLFTYLDSWVKPDDAFDSLTNAYVYRGSLYQREGIVLFPSFNGAGQLIYENNQIVSVGDGGSSYAYNIAPGVPLSDFPIFGTVTITARTTAGIRSSTATGNPGDGAVAWSTGGGLLATAGTINFDTGEWDITTSATIAGGGSARPIVISYNFIPTNSTSGVGGTSTNNPIMGIKLHQDQTSSTQTLIVMDTRRASYWDPSTTSFEPLSEFEQILWVSDGVTTTTPTIFIQWTDTAPYSFTIEGDGDSVTDSPTTSVSGAFTNDGNLNPGGSSVIYDTGAVILTFTAAAPAGTVYTIRGKVRADYFTGDNSNFFNSTNWQTDDNQPSYLYMTNNVDNVTLFDGEFLARPPFATVSTNMIQDSTGFPWYPKQNNIEKVLDVKVYKNRLLFLRPTLIDRNTDGQSIRWSYQGTEGSPLGNFNFITDLVGFGGEFSAATGDWIQSSQFLRDFLIVFFQNSTWIFRFTGNSLQLFRWDKVNGSRSTNAPYGSVEYDAFCTSMGVKGLIQCSGYEVERYDIDIIDRIEQINQNRFHMCFAQKFDTLNQTWMLYPSTEEDDATSDSVLVYNFLENAWAIFKPNLGNLVQTPTRENTLSCLGLGFATKDLTWEDFAVGTGYFSGNGQTWSEAEYAWNSNVQQDISPNLLGGDQNGFVYVMNEGSRDMPGPSQSAAYGITVDTKTKLFNPFIAQGMKARFGYLDIYYLVNPSVSITVNFYLNNSTTVAMDGINTRTVVLDGKPNETWAWKRVYIGAVAEFIQIGINNVDSQSQTEDDAVFQILGMILYAKPSGRLTPGTFL